MANMIRQNNFTHLFAFLKKETMTDVTLMAEGKAIKAHALILAAASKYFEELFVTLQGNKHPVIVLKDVSVKYLLLILEYVYCGHVDLSSEDVEEFKKVAENMNIKVEFKVEPDQDINQVEEMMSQDTIPIDGEMHFEEGDDDVMNPTYEDIMGTSETMLSISSVQSLSRESKRLAKSLSKLKQEPPAKKSKQQQDISKEIDLPTGLAVSVGLTSQCIYCDKHNREKDKNYHQKHCWKNLNRIVSNCKHCKKKFEFPSKLRQHQIKSHPGKYR